MLEIVLAIMLILSPAAACAARSAPQATPPMISAYLSIGTSELAYDGQDATTAVASIYATAPATITVALAAPPALLVDRTPRQVVVAPGQPATLRWRVVLDQADPVPDRRPLEVRLLVGGQTRAAVPVRAWLLGTPRPGWAIYAPIVRG